MNYNKVNILVGKVRVYDNFVGEVVSSEGIYIFTQDGIPEGEEIAVNDLILFRGEEVQNQKVAYFIKKLNPEKDIYDQIYTETGNMDYNKEDFKI